MVSEQDSFGDRDHCHGFLVVPSPWNFHFPLVHSPFSGYLNTNTVISPFFATFLMHPKAFTTKARCLNSAHRVCDLAAAWLFCFTHLSLCPSAQPFLSHLTCTSASVTSHGLFSPHPSLLQPIHLPPSYAFLPFGHFFILLIFTAGLKRVGAAPDYAMAFAVPAPLLAHNRCSLNNWWMGELIL